MDEDDEQLAPQAIQGFNAISDELILSIFCQLDDPSPFSMVCKRVYHISRDPYTRAMYFIERHGKYQAIYFAVGRGKLVTERVLDILLSSGAHLSRYLLQSIVGHYTRPSSLFYNRSIWCRSLPFTTFAYVLKLGAEKFGNDVDVCKGQDDGAVFSAWLDNKKHHHKFVGPLGHENEESWHKRQWEVISTIFEKFGFIPFSPRDPLMVRFPLALSLEPRLLPLAQANGFEINPSYRDFIFRKIFEKLPDSSSDTGHETEIIENVKILCKLDPNMFLSRTVAAEICVDVKTNPLAFSALKRLDRLGELHFQLSDLVADLLKLFSKTRSVCLGRIIPILHTLYEEFPMPHHPDIRPMILVTVFADNTHSTAVYASASTKPSLVTEAYRLMHNRLNDLGVLPLTRDDLVAILKNPFVDAGSGVLDFAKKKLGFMDSTLITVAEEVVLNSLEVSCKGKTLKSLTIRYPELKTKVSQAIKSYQFDFDALTMQSRTKLAKLSIDVLSGSPYSEPIEVEEIKEQTDVVEINPSVPPGINLGRITQDSLAWRIVQDERGMRKPRRRYFYDSSAYGPPNPIGYEARRPYPDNAMNNCQFVLDVYGSKSLEAAIFFTHAMANTLNSYSALGSCLAKGVPVTLKHFKILAKLDTSPHAEVWEKLKTQEFFFDEHDYLRRGSRHSTSPVHSFPLITIRRLSDSEERMDDCGSPPRKRPRRAAAALVKSYLLPDVDDDDDSFRNEPEVTKKPFTKHAKKKAGDVRTWIKHLTILLKDEQKKWNERKRNAVRDEETGKLKQRIYKSCFHSELSRRLAFLRSWEMTKSKSAKPMEESNLSEDENSDDDYGKTGQKRKRGRPARPKRRAVEMSERGSLEGGDTQDERLSEGVEGDVGEGISEMKVEED